MNIELCDGMDIMRWMEEDAGLLTHIYTWGNNPKRAMMKGKSCRIITRGRMNSVLIELENGQREIVSRRALRRK